MKTKYAVISIMALLMLSNATALATVKAPAWPLLPATLVHLTAADGVASHFISTLSGVPPGYDVQNGAYPGWCIDPGKYMPRGDPHNVMLYSSISPPVLPHPPYLSSVNWVAINYVLNHKQGDMEDVQDAIWHYTIGFAPSDLDALAMIAAADANPSYDPMTGTVLAVLCIPLPVTDHDLVQDSIIELPHHPSGPGYTPGFWKHNIGVALGYNPGEYSAFRDGTKLTLAMLQGYATIVGVTLQEAYGALTARGPGMDTVRANMANAFNAAAGYGPF
jgi:hypothetical protein